MKHFRQFLLLTLGLIFASAAGFSVWQNTTAQTRPLTYPELNTALNSKLPNSAFKNKTQLINWLITQIWQRKVDKPLTEDREDDLRQAGATDELIETIRRNSPPISKPTATPARTPTSSNNSNAFKNSIGMEFVKIPAGSFTMGSPPGEKDREDNENQHRVTIGRDFYLGKYEVTQAQWKAVMGSNPSIFKGDNLPVENVSWDDAQEFIKKLNAKGEGTYRLPTEAEWEYAARAGTTTAFSFGDSLSSEQANFDGNYPYGTASKGKYLAKTTPVGSYAPNGWGLYDMHGNVWEWCADWYGDYPDGSVADPTGPGSGSNRVNRGGSWRSHGRGLRSAYRYGYVPSDRYYILGFRLVRN